MSQRRIVNNLYKLSFGKYIYLDAVKTVTERQYKVAKYHSTFS